MEINEDQKDVNSKIIDDLGYGNNMVDSKSDVLRQNF